MKKITVLFMSILLVFTFAACGKQDSVNRQRGQAAGWKGERFSSSPSEEDVRIWAQGFGL